MILMIGKCLWCLCLCWVFRLCIVCWVVVILGLCEKIVFYRRLIDDRFVSLFFSFFVIGLMVYVLISSLV